MGGDAGPDDPVDQVTVLEILAILDRAGRAVHHEVHAPGTIRRHRLRGPIAGTAGGRFDDHGREQIERPERRDDPVDGGQVARSRPAAPAPAPARSRRCSPCSPVELADSDSAVEACPFVQSCRATAVPVSRRTFLR